MPVTEPAGPVTGGDCLSFTETVLLGALAGATIFLSLPFGRLSGLGARAKVALAMFAVGILAFLVVDVLAHAFEIVEDAMLGYKDGDESLARVAALAALLGIGFTTGCAGLGLIDARVRRRRLAPVAGGAVDVVSGPAAHRPVAAGDDARRRTLRTGMTIAVAIGVHNFAEGLAIGVSANAGEIGLATVLIVGFALHNATEGFAIVGPLGNVRPSWRWLALAGAVGGGPTFVGSIIGYQVSSEPLELAFYALAGGAILTVVNEVWQAMRRLGHRELGLLLLSVGFFTGVVTDLVVAYGGG